MSLIDDVLKTLADGYVPYRGAIEGGVFEGLRCPDFRRARWFTREGRHLCLGCARRCAWAGPGFQAVLPLARDQRPAGLAYGQLPYVTAEELLAAKAVLRVDEAAFVLNVSERTVRDLIDSAKLDRLPDLPVRVTTASVRAALQVDGK